MLSIAHSAGIIQWVWKVFSWDFLGDMALVGDNPNMEKGLIIPADYSIIKKITNAKIKWEEIVYQKQTEMFRWEML